MSVKLFGIKLPTPIFMAPIGVIGICAQDGHGDLAVARAAARTGGPMGASTLTVDPLEAGAKEFGDTPGLCRLYALDDRGVAESFVRRPQVGGVQGIVVTVVPRGTPGEGRGWLPRHAARGRGSGWEDHGPVRFGNSDRDRHH